MTCAFCFKAADEVGLLLQGPKPDVHICDKCVEHCMYIVLEDRRSRSKARQTLEENQNKWAHFGIGEIE